MPMAIAFSAASPFAALRSPCSSTFNPILLFPVPLRSSSAHKRIVRMCASVDRAGSVGSVLTEWLWNKMHWFSLFFFCYIFIGWTTHKFEQGNDDVPMPIVHIDQDSDPYGTVVQVSFGDRLGAFLDTMKALTDLGLDVSEGSVGTENSVKETKLFITLPDTGRKVENPDLLESIRLTIINNLLKYHPESSEKLAMGAAFGIKPPPKKIDVDVATQIHVKADGLKRSLLYVETADRPGLLMEMIKVMSDINVNVESAEIDTEGLVAKDTFHVSYRGASLNSSMSQVLVNCLRYYLRRPQTDEGSY